MISRQPKMTSRQPKTNCRRPQMTSRQPIKEQLGEADKISSLQNSPYRGVSEQPDDPYYSDFTGSTFVRWGRQSCPGNTSLIYADLPLATLLP
ncbi:hypothetical protein V1264_019628 [Littorina saxatilis]|uniref:Uncharacterized protein n=1 Tax=Littorina saxatilis TaxID=31220 RepID=A0AAN9GE45_9CAEN